MARTRSQFIESVLKRLNRLAAGQEAAAEDVEAVDALIDPTFAELMRLDVAYLPDSEHIDEALFNALVDVVAATAAPDFSVTAAELAANGVSRADAEERLRLLTRPMAALKNQRIEPFWIRRR
jgi:hypothetical protein